MKTKIFIIIILVSVLSCNNDDSLEAHLINLNDKTFYEDPHVSPYSDESDALKDGQFASRTLIPCYRIINTCNDSIFVPFDVYHDPDIKIHFQGKDSISVLECGSWCYGTKDGTSDNYAPKDTIFLIIRMKITSPLEQDRKWLENVDVRELVSLLNINVSFKTEVHSDDIHKIPRIMFKNDTTGIAVNPKIRIQKNLKNSNYELN